MRASIAEGIFAEIVTACTTGGVLTAWSIATGGGALLLGLLASLPFISQLAQLPAAWLTARFGARRTAIVAVAASRQIYLPLALVPWLGLSRAAEQLSVFAVIAAASVLGVLGNNAWVSWMGDLVPSAIRGRYFGRRTAACAVGAALTSFACSFILDFGNAHDRLGAMLSLLSLFAWAAGSLTTKLMLAQHEPRRAHAELPLTLATLLAPLRDPRARRVVGYQMCWNFAIGVASSFYALHMLQNLRLPFAVIGFYAAAVALMRLASARLWGRALDRFGIRPVLATCVFGLCSTPLLWLLTTPDRLWPIAVDAIFSGVLWGGHVLATFTLPIGMSPSRERPIYLATFAMAGGVAYAVASSLGGTVATVLPASWQWGGYVFYGLQVLFVASAAGRIAAGFLCLRLVEPRARPYAELQQWFIAEVRRMPPAPADAWRQFSRLGRWPVRLMRAGDRGGDERRAG